MSGSVIRSLLLDPDKRVARDKTREVETMAGGPARSFAQGAEPQPGVMVPDHAVLRGWDVFADEPPCAVRLDQHRDEVERCRLDLPTEHAAAHQPGVDQQIRIVPQPADHNADDP